MPVEIENSSGPVPLLPAEHMNTPLEVNFWSRLFPSSDTKMFPLPSTATPRGLINSPSPEPWDPNIPIFFPPSKMLTLWSSVNPLQLMQFTHCHTIRYIGHYITRYIDISTKSNVSSVQMKPRGSITYSIFCRAMQVL